MQAFGVDVRVLCVAGGPVEAACAEAVELHLVRPDILVQGGEVVFVDEAILGRKPFVTGCFREMDRGDTTYRPVFVRPD